MTTSIQHTLQFLIRPLTARNSISLKSRITARGPVSASSRHVRDALAPRSRPSAPPGGSEQHGTWGGCVGCRAQPSFRLQTRQKKQRIHGADLTSRQKKKTCENRKKKNNDSSITSVCLETNTRCTLWDADVTTDTKTLQIDFQPNCFRSRYCLLTGTGFFSRGDFQ